MKKPYLSKTLWVNALVAIAAFFPGLQETVSAENLMMLAAVVNMGLRLVTKDAIGLEA